MNNSFYNQPDDALRLLSINQVRNLLKISHSKATRLVISGEIKYLKVEGKIKVPKINVWNYVNKSENQSEDTYAGSDIKKHIMNIIGKDD